MLVYMKVFRTDDSVLSSTALSLFVVAGKANASNGWLAISLSGTEISEVKTSYARQLQK